MHRTQSLSITLPEDLAEMVKAKVQSGEYASESEVVQDSLHAMFNDTGLNLHHDPEIERWLREEVVPTLREVDAHPEQLLTVDEVSQRIDALAASLADQHKRG
jgi:putative addiction module CopG family antidote